MLIHSSFKDTKKAAIVEVVGFGLAVYDFYRA